MASDPINFSEIFAEQLPGFLDELRVAGYHIGTGEYLSAYTLLLNLAEQGKLPRGPRRLKSFLSPIVCTCAKEQRDFSVRFDERVRQFDASNKGRKASEQAEMPDKIPYKPDSIRARSRLWIPIFGIITVLLGAGVFYAFPFPQTLRMPSLFSFPGVFFLMGGAAGLGLLAWLIREIWWGYLARTYLVARSTSDPFDVLPFWVKGSEGKLFQSVTLLRTARELRRHVRTEHEELDADATAERTAEMAGCFSPVNRSPQVMPEYLILIDRATFRDHQALWADALVNRLVDNEVFLERYYFDGDPRSCVPEKGGPALGLWELARRHPDHRVIIFSDGAGLTDPLTGEPARWIEQFYTWKERSLLTLESAGELREHPLADADFMVMPAGERGLDALIEDMNAETSRAPGGFGKPLPGILQGVSIRWRERLEPDAEDIGELTRAIRGFLDEKGWYWLCACAVYPEVNWHLTLELGCSLKGEDGRLLFDQERLAGLARLPWFRYGRMPDWFRRYLIRSLPAHREKKVRKVLFRMILTASGSAPEGFFPLEYARRRGSVTAGMVRRVFGLFSRRPRKRGPLQDHIFVTFMRNPLGVRIPKMLNRFFRRGTGESGETPAEEEVKTIRERRPGRPEKIVNSLGMEFVYIPSGTFMMGSPEDEPGRYADEKLHKVTLTRGFYMQNTPVTQGQWKAAMGNNPSYFKNCGDDCPVEDVSWDDAQEFIRNLNHREGGGKYRLPTEAEWEYACRAGSTTALYTGSIEIIGKNNAPALDPIAWYGGKSGVEYKRGTDSSRWKEEQYESNQSGTHPVGQKEPNIWGLYDMLGNVLEWCSDWYDDYPSGDITDPTGPQTGSGRVVRGGSWDYGARGCRSAYRNLYSSGLHFRNGGLRIALFPSQGRKPAEAPPEPRERPATGPIYRLRSEPRKLSEKDGKAMLAKYNFFNKSGDFRNDFTDNGDGTVTDHITWLMWQRSGADDLMTFEEAWAYVDDLNSKQFAGYSDWRLPTLEELASLIENKEAEGFCIDPIFDKRQRWCWSSDKRSSGSAWLVDFSDIDIGWSDLNDPSYVRGVRSRQY
ncbi:SUMF1/EgtB/PvdO family nonheme iron enzyme [Desulfococcaceae bacterium HSG8]|nr:SUMF1/EgtB/PvdO family nonheme iron enzyme [Desulfococcaceae bacterium HSG8]